MASEQPPRDLREDIHQTVTEEQAEAAARQLEALLRYRNDLLGSAVTLLNAALLGGFDPKARLLVVSFIEGAGPEYTVATGTSRLEQLVPVVEQLLANWKAAIQAAENRIVVPGATGDA